MMSCQDVERLEADALGTAVAIAEAAVQDVVLPEALLLQPGSPMPEDSQHAQRLRQQHLVCEQMEDGAVRGVRTQSFFTTCLGRKLH